MLPLIRLSKPQFYYWKMVGSRYLSPSKALGTAVHIPHTAQVPCSSHHPGDQSTRSALSSKSLGGTGQATMAPTPAQPLTGKPGRDAKDHGDRRDLAPLCRVPICSQQDQGLETGAGDGGCLWYSPSVERGLCAWMSSNAGPHKTLKLLSPKQCC